METDHCTYCVFPPGVVSNTFDFEVDWGTHAGKSMRGVFARRAIQSEECPIFIGAYQGYPRSTREMKAKVSSYATRNGVARRNAIRQTGRYVLSFQRIAAGFSLDPSDEDGCLLPEFTPYIANYLNEPPPAEIPKAAFVFNRVFMRYEVWLLQGLCGGDEVFLFYGRGYIRDYPVEDRFPLGQPAYYIPSTSVIRMDPRGVPDPLRLPGGGSHTE